MEKNNFSRGYAAFTSEWKSQKFRENNKFLCLVGFRDSDVNLQSHFRCLRAEGEPGHLHRFTQPLPVDMSTVASPEAAGHRNSPDRLAKKNTKRL